MARPKPSKETKIKIDVRVSPELFEWIDARSGDGREFHNWTHAVESGLRALREGLRPARKP